MQIQLIKPIAIRHNGMKKATSVAHKNVLDIDQIKTEQHLQKKNLGALHRLITG